MADDNNHRVREVSTNSPGLVFSDTAIGATSALQTVALANIGNGELNFGGLTTSSADFLLDSSGTWSGVPKLIAGNSCTLALGFQPQQTGARTGTATVTDDNLNVPGSAQVVQLNGNGLPVTTTNVLSLSTSNVIAFGTTVTLTANVNPFSAGAVTTTGTMSFYDGATLLGTAPVSATGEAGINVSTFTVGSDSLTAVYAGDSNFSTSTSAAVPLTVNTTPIAISLVSSDNPSNYGQSVTFTATVTSGATGTVQFFDGASALGSPVMISGTAAALATSTLTVGGHGITAHYSGDGSHAAAISGALNQMVEPALLTVTATSASRVYGEANPTSFTYTITGFVATDTQAGVVSGAPQITTTATESSAAGGYPITHGLGTLAATNYTFTFVPGTLTVTKATPAWEEWPQ